jgi:hypothetical protein
MRQPTPLQFSMYEAIGEPIATTNLPLAFAHADLRDVTGWKPRIAAAERLARVGAIPAERLFEIYNERMPAASGGVWDRIEAVQRFQLALERANPTAVAQSLPAAFAAMQEVGLDVPFAEMFATALSPLPLTGTADRIRLKVGLLSPRAAQIARAHGPTTPEEAFQVALATGDLAETPAPEGVAEALREGLLAEAPPPETAELIAQGRKGEALLNAIALFDVGATGNYDALRDAIAALVALGQGEAARHAAREVLLLDLAP